MRQKNLIPIKSIIVCMGVFLFLMVLMWGLFLIAGKPIIQSMYDKTAPADWLNQIITQQSKYPVEHYLLAAQKKLIQITTLLAGVCFSFCAILMALFYLGWQVISISFIIAAVFFELWFNYLFQHWQYLSKMPFFLDEIRYLYREGHRNLLHHEEACIKFDPELIYTLKQGKCSFGNFEFSNDYMVNSMGLRDDENSLQSPEVIVLGDSFAMGWGVDQPDSFPDIVEKETGFKVLNAAIPSYGTVREMKMLSRLDTTNLKFLVIQHSPNDTSENRAYYLGKYPLQYTPDYHEKRAKYYEKIRQYYPGKFVVMIATKFIKDIWANFDLRLNQLAVTDAEMFVHAVLSLGGQKLNDSVKVIIIDVESYKNSSNFESQLKAVLKEKRYPVYLREATVIDTASHLDETAYFTVDDHINRNGHRVVADLVKKAMSESKN